jgi:hypothetical protein
MPVSGTKKVKEASPFPQPPNWRMNIKRVSPKISMYQKPTYRMPSGHRKRFKPKAAIRYVEIFVSHKVDKDMLEELKENLKGKKLDQKEEVIAVFCQKTGLTMDECKVYYKLLVKDGSIKEK